MADGDSVWLSLGKFVMQLFLNKAKEDDEKGDKRELAPTELNIVIPVDGPADDKPAPEKGPDMEFLPETAINWESATCNITQHFLVGDAIALHSWNRLANEEDGLTDDGKAKLVVLCNKMEEIRKILGCPITIHCMYRSQKYNKEIVKAIPNDVHAQFLAADWDCNGHHTIDEVHAILEPLLEQLGIRMERNTPKWIHIDLHPVVHQRYFTA